MPCRDSYGDECNTRTNNELRDKVDELTAMLCGVCQYLEKSIKNYPVDRMFCDKIHTSLYSWWVNHKNLDKKRLEKAKVSALAKLTDDEKEALGVK